MEKKEEIISNKIKCKKCGDVIESKSTNDLKKMFLWGCCCWWWERKRLGNEKDYEELSIKVKK